MDRITGVLNILSLGREYVLYDGCVRDWSAVGRLDDKLRALGLLEKRETFIFLQDYAATKKTVYHGACETIRTEYAMEIVRHLAEGDPFRRIKITWIGGTHYLRATAFRNASFSRAHREVGMYHIFPCNEKWLWTGIKECDKLDEGMAPWHYCLPESIMAYLEHMEATDVFSSINKGITKEKGAQ